MVTVILPNIDYNICLSYKRESASIAIINAQDVEYCMTAKRECVENHSIIISVLHVINLVSFH